MVCGDSRVILPYRFIEKVGYNEAPKTWDELSDAALKLSKRGKDMYGFAIDPNEQTTGFIFGRQNGSLFSIKTVRQYSIKNLS